MIAAFGNETVIQALEMMLAKAREGRAGYFLGLLSTDGERPLGGWFGNPALEASAIRNLKEMTAEMDRLVVNKTLPSRIVPASPDRVCYNIADGNVPASFDFIHWLIDAEMTRRLAGAPAPLKVGFWFGRDGKTGLEYPARKMMFDNVMRPALGLIGAVEVTTAADDGTFKQAFGFKDVTDRARAGAEVPRFSAPTDLIDFVRSKHRKPPVTITLREWGDWPHRNSNMSAWLRFAFYLRSCGEDVVFVRDTAKALEPVEGFETCPEASLNLHYRTALYQTARMNLFVSNGPATIAYFSDFPWMMFLKMEPDGHPYTPNTPGFWRREFGMEEGDQFPWSRADQCIVWAGDDYDNLVAAWDDMQSSWPAAAE